MDLKEIKELIALMRKNDLSVFKMEKEGFKITLKKGTDFQPATTNPPPVLPPPSRTGEGAGPDSSETPPPHTLREITSPTVGTFYVAPTPDAPPYVTVGQEVTEHTVVGILEAMKVMNEIKAGISGVIAEVIAENGKPVQWGQLLFRVR